MLSKRMLTIGSLLLLLSTFMVPAIWGGTSGKIAGIVTDVETGGPIEGATIQVEGMNLTTFTDSDGEFYIINVPVGKYNLTVGMLGRESILFEEIRVLMDLTTPLECSMKISPLETGKVVTVRAERPVIQKDQTSSGEIVTREEISSLANSRSIQAIISNMNGTVEDDNGTIHVRGGRQGTISYYYDGFSIQDPFFSTQGMMIDPETLEELSLISGGLSPEYGEALSGVVNAITREGSQEYHGRIRIYDGASPSYDVTQGKFSGLKRLNNNAIALDLSGPLMNIGGRWATFFSSFEYIKNDGYLPHSNSKSFSGSGKTVLYPSGNTKLIFNGSYYFQDRDQYTHRDVNGMSYDFNLDGLGKSETESYLVGLKGQYNKSTNTVISGSVNRFRTKTRNAPKHLFDLYWTQWPGYTVNANGEYDGTIHKDNYQVAPEYYYTGFTIGDDFDPIFHERFSAYTGGQFSYLSQMSKHNQVKFGGDLRRYELYYDERQFLNAKPYGETYSAFPWFGAAYVQNKLELYDMVMNVGVRFDYLHADMEYWNNPINKDYRKKTSAKIQWSPRLGISHPISENSVLHFNYGYLFQPPQAYLMYTNLDGNLESGYPLFGNPDLDAEKTVYYELGFKHLMGDVLRLELTTYYKDIKDMIGAREVVDDVGNVYTVYTNSDYGSTKGFDIALENVNQSYLGWSLRYSYMIASGNASDPNDWYYDYYTVVPSDRPPVPTREYPLAFDQRHNLTAVADFRVLRNQDLTLFGTKLPDAWGINFLASFGSGLAYTRTGKDGTIGALNAERMPSTFRVDMRFNKDFYLGERDGNFVSFFLEVENLLDRRNVLDVYRNTGEPDMDGVVVLNANDGNFDENVRLHNLMQNDPQNFDQPRQLRLGLSYNF